MTDSTPVGGRPAGQDHRTFDAPRQQVFRAWTDPDEVAAWYGPEHVDTPRERIHIDLRVGGRYELTMVQRDSRAGLAIRQLMLATVALRAKMRPCGKFLSTSDGRTAPTAARPRRPEATLRCVGGPRG